MCILLISEHPCIKPKSVSLWLMFENEMAKCTVHGKIDLKTKQMAIFNRIAENRCLYGFLISHWRYMAFSVVINAKNYNIFQLDVNVITCYFEHTLVR